VLHAAGPGRRVGQFSRIGFCECDQFLHGREQQLGVSDQNVGLIGEDRDRRKRGEIERELRKKNWVHCKRRCRRGEQGVPVRLGPGCRLGADVGVSARPILDVDGIAPSAGQLLGDEARHQICDAAGPNRGDDLDRPVGIGVLRERRDGHETHAYRQHNPARYPRLNDHLAQAKHSALLFGRDLFRSRYSADGTS
jgi:hypothetical protein